MSVPDARCDRMTRGSIEEALMRASNASDSKCAAPVQNTRGVSIGTGGVVPAL